MILSGGYLMTPYGSMLTATPLLMLKLALVVVLSALIGIISAKARKVREGDTDAQLRNIAHT